MLPGSSDAILSVCIPTFCRPKALAALLASLDAQRDVPEGWTVEILVADNDPGGSASGAFHDGPTRWPRRYLRVPQQSIARARNALAAAAAGDWIVFLDDDQLAPPLLLRELAREWAEHGRGADGGVFALTYDGAPSGSAWRRARRLFRERRFPAGATVRAEHFAGNGFVVSRRALAGAGEAPFPLAFGLTGSEDTMFFLSCVRRGLRFVHLAATAVVEIVPPARLGVAALVERAWREGLCFARWRPVKAEAYGERALPNLLYLPACAALAALALGGSCLVAPLSPARGLELLARAAFRAATIAGALGLDWDYYARRPGADPGALAR